MKPLKKFRRYVPQLIHDELKKIDYPRKDNLYVIIDLINRKEIYYKSDEQRKYCFTEIPVAAFKELLPSSDNLNEDMQFLIEEGLIKRNEYYSMGIKPKSYKIPREYLGTTVPVIIENKNINKRILKQIDRFRKLKVQSVQFAKTDYYKTFKIDIKEANKAILRNAISEVRALCLNSRLNLTDIEIMDLLDCKNNFLNHRLYLISKVNELNNIIHRYMIHKTRVNAINDGFLFFKRNSTNGRLDTNLTSLPSFLRPYIISSEKLMNIDIKNSQPYFLYTLLKSNPDINPEELKRYSELVIEGNLYEYLEDKYYQVFRQRRTRIETKKMLCKIFYSKNSSFTKWKIFLGSLFPSIMQFINKTNSEKHNTLSIMLTSVESYSVLDVMMPLLRENGITPYTIHDSFICKESQAQTLLDLLDKKFTELYGVAPSMHADYIDKIDEEDDSGLDWDDMVREE